MIWKEVILRAIAKRKVDSQRETKDKERGGVARPENLLMAGGVGTFQEGTQGRKRSRKKFNRGNKKT